MNETTPQKLGRIIRIDQKLRETPAVGLWVMSTVLHGLLGLVVITAVLGNNHPDSEPPTAAALVALAAMWLAIGTGLELTLLWARTFELQLLPSAVHVTKWGRTVKLIQPQIVGGSLWNDVIRLQAGQVSASISLNSLNQREDKAAVVEHCSQFLSAEQQARYGRRWAERYYRLITPVKPPSAMHVLRLTLVCFVVGGMVLAGVCEPLLWYFPDAQLKGGQSPRWSYLGWTAMAGLFAAMIVGPYYFAERKMAAEQAKLARLNSA